MSIKNKLTIAVFGLLCVGGLYKYLAVGRSPQAASAKQHASGGGIFTVAESPNVKMLYFNGLVQPKSVRNVSSPVEGEVRKKFFRYGETVSKDAQLLVINSEKLKQDYQQALTEFLKAKELNQTSLKKWRGTEELNKLGFVSKNQYADEKHSLQESTLQFYQAKQKLEEIVGKTNQNVNEIMEKIESLRLVDIEKVSKSLKIGHDTLVIRAPTDGVVLYPERSSGGGSGGGSGAPSSDLSQGILVGTSIKSGEVLLAIGDLSGLSIKFQVNEVNILKLKHGQSVTITGVAFPDVTLHGTIESIDTQATQGEGGVPVFNVRVVVPTVSAQELSKVHIGMSAKLEIKIASDAQIEIPINAVSQDLHTGAFVHLKKENNTIEKVPVQTGDTSQDKVVILKGLKPGDQVVLPD
jgi:HlyD family secretion protein